MARDPRILPAVLLHCTYMYMYVSGYHVADIKDKCQQGCKLFDDGLNMVFLSNYYTYKVNIVNGQEREYTSESPQRLGYWQLELCSLYLCGSQRKIFSKCQFVMPSTVCFFANF